MSIAYKRILLKLSGEVLAGEKKTGIDNDTVVTICNLLRRLPIWASRSALLSAAAIFGVAERASIWTEQGLTISVCLQPL